MDRRRFIRVAGLGLASLPLAEFLAACGDAAEVVAGPTAEPVATPVVTPPSTSTSEPEEPQSTQTDPSVPQAAVIGAICREAWGATEPGEGLEPHTIERLTVHHTAATLTDNRWAPAALRGHQAYHKSLGWPDLAYHVAVDAEGNIYAGRPASARGDTATTYDPTGHFLVVAEGNFDDQAIPPAQVEGVAMVLAWAAAEFGVDPQTITGHRDWASTSCPGDIFYRLIADGTLAARVAELVSYGGVDLRVVCDESAFEAVTAIETGAPPPPLAVQASFYLRDANTAGNAEQVIEFGDAGWLPVSGEFGE
jgi:hypothetical protein